MHRVAVLSKAQQAKAKQTSFILVFWKASLRVEEENSEANRSFSTTMERIERLSCNVSQNFEQFSERRKTHFLLENKTVFFYQL